MGQPIDFYSRPTIPNTLLWLKMEGTNGSNTFIDSSTYANVVTTVGNVVIDTSTFAVGTSSAKFPGDGVSYLSIPPFTALDFETSDFTISLYVKFSSIPVNQAQRFIYQADAGVTTWWQLRYDDTNKGINFKFVFAGNGYISNIACQYLWDWTPTTGVWYYLKLQRVGTILTMYVDNVVLAEKEIPFVFQTVHIVDHRLDYIPQNVVISGTTSVEIFGWLDEVKIILDTAKPVNFYSRPIIPSNIEDFNFSSNDFTIEFYIRFNSLDSVGNHDNIIMSLGSYSDNPFNSWRVSIFDSFAVGNFVVYFAYNVSGTLFGTSKNWIPSLNTWYNLAIVRNGANLYLFIDGVSVGWNAGNPYNIGTDVIKDTSVNNINNGLSFGACVFSALDPTLKQYLDGWLDEVRISNIARYTSGFTPSTTPFVTDANTLLLLHGEGTNGSRDFIDSTGRHTLSVLAPTTVQIDTSQFKVGSSSIRFSTSNAYTGPGGALIIPFTGSGKPVNIYSLT